MAIIEGGRVRVEVLYQQRREERGENKCSNSYSNSRSAAYIKINVNIIVLSVIIFIKLGITRIVAIPSRGQLTCR